MITLELEQTELIKSSFIILLNTMKWEIAK